MLVFAPLYQAFASLWTATPSYRCSKLLDAYLVVADVLLVITDVSLIVADVPLVIADASLVISDAPTGADVSSVVTGIWPSLWSVNLLKEIYCFITCRCSLGCYRCFIRSCWCSIIVTSDGFISHCRCSNRSRCFTGVATLLKDSYCFITCRCLIRRLSCIGSFLLSLLKDSYCFITCRCLISRLSCIGSCFFRHLRASEQWPLQTVKLLAPLQQPHLAGLLSRNSSTR